MDSIHQVQHKPWSGFTEYGIHWKLHVLSTEYTKYSIHQVQNTLCKAYYRQSIYQTFYVVLLFSWLQVNSWKQLQVLVCLSLYLLPAANSPWELQGKVNLSHSDASPITNGIIWLHYDVYLQIDNIQINWLQMDDLLINYFHLLLQFPYVMSPKCISKLAGSWPQSLSLK